MFHAVLLVTLFSLFYCYSTTITSDYIPPPVTDRLPLETGRSTIKLGSFKLLIAGQSMSYTIQITLTHSLFNNSLPSIHIQKLY